MNKSYQPDMSRVACGTACIIRPLAPPADDQENEILTIARIGAHGAGTISVPGGWVAKGEDPAEAIMRECWEEVGLAVSAVKFRGYTHDLHDEGVEDICLWFDAVAWAGTPRNTNPDRVSSVEWMTANHLLSHTLFMPLRNALLKGVVTV